MRILAIFFISLSMNLLAVQAYPDAMPFPMAQKEKTYRISKPKYSQKHWIKTYINIIRNG